MKNVMWFVLACMLGSMVMACSASVTTAANTSGTASDVDWRRAYVMGESRCDRNQAGATQADYVACLEESQRILNETKAAMPGSQNPTTPPPTASALPPQPQPVPSQPTTPMLPQPGTGTPPTATPPQQPPGSVFIPGATGPVCSTNQDLILTVPNNTDRLVEARSPYIAPLGCDAANTLTLRWVIRKGGQRVQVWVVPPHTTARYVFLPLNGGLGNVRVIYNAFMDLSSTQGEVTSPQVGWMTDTGGPNGYQVPRSDGHGWTEPIETWKFHQ